MNASEKQKIFLAKLIARCHKGKVERSRGIINLANLHLLDLVDKDYDTYGLEHWAIPATQEWINNNCPLPILDKKRCSDLIEFCKAQPNIIDVFFAVHPEKYKEFWGNYRLTN